MIWLPATRSSLRLLDVSLCLLYNKKGLGSAVELVRNRDETVRYKLAFKHRDNATNSL